MSIGELERRVLDQITREYEEMLAAIKRLRESKFSLPVLHSVSPPPSFPNTEIRMKGSDTFIKDKLDQAVTLFKAIYPNDSSKEREEEYQQVLNEEMQKAKTILIAQDMPVPDTDSILQTYFKRNH